MTAQVVSLDKKFARQILIDCNSTIYRQMTPNDALHCVKIT